MHLWRRLEKTRDWTSQAAHQVKSQSNQTFDGQRASVYATKCGCHTVYIRLFQIAKWQMSTACAASKRMRRFQEALLEQHGLIGLLFMLRGINFTIYGVL